LSGGAALGKVIRHSSSYPPLGTKLGHPIFDNFMSQLRQLYVTTKCSPSLTLEDTSGVHLMSPDVLPMVECGDLHPLAALKTPRSISYIPYVVGVFNPSNKRGL